MSSRRLEALIALSKDPGATEAERALAAERAAEMGADTYVETVFCDDDKIIAFDRAMVKAMAVRSPQYRAARIRAVHVWAPPGAAEQWLQSRGRAITR